METELFDIYDENNQPLGIQKSRSVVHKELKDWHRATHIWIVNEKGQILCQQRSMKKDVNPGKWQSFFGGHLKAGQTYESNALAELREELGLNIEAQDLIPIRTGKDEDVKHFGQVYLIKWNGNESDVHFDDGEVESVKWFDLKDVESSIASGEFCNGVDASIHSYLGTHY
jgi:16S rRNA (adenine1518-N6/adenine1519-N6)-dimethyltransferase